MFLCKPRYEIEYFPPRESILDLIERAGRTCYKSETKGEPDQFVKKIVQMGHLSVIEHVNVTIRFIVDTGVTHGLVRHRVASYSQESTRYCNYYGGVTFIIPPWAKIEPNVYHQVELTEEMSSNDVRWMEAMLRAEKSYLELLENGWTPQQARAVLPKSLKTEIVMTANLREWLHVFNLRCSKAAHPQMREIMLPLYQHFNQVLPEIFTLPIIDNDLFWNKDKGITK